MELLDGFCPSFLKTNPVLADGVYGALTNVRGSACALREELTHSTTANTPEQPRRAIRKADMLSSPMTLIDAA